MKIQESELKIFIGKLKLLSIMFVFRLSRFAHNKRFLFILFLLLSTISWFRGGWLLLSITLFVGFYYLTLYKDVGKFICVNVYTGTINMRNDIDMSLFKNCKNDYEKLNVLVNGFVSDVLNIPYSLKFAPFLLFKRQLRVSTHKTVFLKIVNIYGDIIKYEEKEKLSPVYEKLFFAKPSDFDIFKKRFKANDKNIDSGNKFYYWVIKNIEKYRIYINFKDLRDAALVADKLTTFDIN